MYLQVLPRQLAVPWSDVSKRLGVDPVLSHASFVLANWKIKDQSKYECDYSTTSNGSYAENMLTSITSRSSRSQKNVERLTLCV